MEQRFNPACGDLGARIQRVRAEDPTVHPDALVAVSFGLAERVVLEARAPLDAWWMLTSRAAWQSPCHEPVAAVAAAEVIVWQHRRRHPR
ncbi:MAG: hypothetical protein M3Q03_17040 [Chloroflexota bacterium]|nr:hypothetical protein [Chloroflexota bacterium]